MKRSAALAAGSLVLPWLGKASEARADGGKLSIAPKYYPLRNFSPQIELRGKLAVITGASRGNGRAIGEALSALGVNVLGTSRNPAGVPNPPAFPLLALDITNPLSVAGFIRALQAHPLFRQHPQVDILANNAGRFVAGRIVPLPPADSSVFGSGNNAGLLAPVPIGSLTPNGFSFYLAQRELGLLTNYSGHVMVTNSVLPLMPQRGYSRILFTVSIDAYVSFAMLPVGSLAEVYATAKVATRVYANNLDMALRQGGSSIRVSTVNPHTVNTALLTHPNPIYTQPINSSGHSDTDPVFNEAARWLRQLLANGLPPSMVGETYAQLLRMNDPEQNVVVASPQEPLATQGSNALIEQEIMAENAVSAVPFTCG
jgi:NAD(P)-dependent dehydrogenase (short-subunit alcohol dehydrogenase family)